MKITDILDFVKRNEYSGFFYTPLIYNNGTSLFFKNPSFILSAKNLKELEKLFIRIEELKQKGQSGYGYIKYEAGYELETKLKHLSDNNNMDIARFYMFDNENTFKIKNSGLDFAGIEYLMQNREDISYQINNFKLNTKEATFINNIHKLKEHIKRGDTYQVNYTIKSTFDFTGDVCSLFMKLIFDQSAAYTAFINDGNDFILSVSPELFFERRENIIICKPMKGTMKRNYNFEKDNEIKQCLEQSKKNRSENVMIVDLLRNDISRIASDGSVKVNKLYETERYETLYQMTSTITAKLNDEIKLSDIFRNIYPCGSITGAPKCRTMEIIYEVEKEKRGIYTGALGIIDNECDVFNVPIRTVIIDKETGKGEMGIGSGIVWESNAEEEYNETILKSNFLTKPTEYFYLFETMLAENGSIFLLNEHIERLKLSAEFFLFPVDNRKVKEKINNSLVNIDKAEQYRIRLTLNKWGEIKCEANILSRENHKNTLAISEIKVSSKNKFNYFKTSNRAIYDNEFINFSDKGFADVVFFNKKDELTEGSRTNIFIMKNGKWLTPKISCGLLNGVYRQHFILNHKDCIETVLYRDDILNADEIILTNAVRKEIKISKVIY